MNNPITPGSRQDNAPNDRTLLGARPLLPSRYNEAGFQSQRAVQLSSAQLDVRTFTDWYFLNSDSQHLLRFRRGCEYSHSRDAIARTGRRARKE